MIITLCNNEQMCKTILPEKTTGRYWIIDTQNNKKRNLICVEARDGKWIANSNKYVRFYDSDNNFAKEMEIKEDSVYLLLNENDERLLLFTHSLRGNGKEYIKLLVPDNKEISIGRDENNAICYVNKYVSGVHFSIKKSGSMWTVHDMNSVNGTYVNNTRIKLKALEPGDVVTVLGLNIIIGHDFIAINNPNYQVVWDSDVLSEYPKQYMEFEESDEELQEVYFYRSPRLKRKLEPLEFNVFPPIARQDGDNMPMAMIMGPSITMGLGSASTGIFSIVNGINEGNSWSALAPTVIMSVSMLCGMLLWPFITKSYEKNKQLKLENKRQQKYREYLANVRDTIAQESALQAEILHENNVSLSECENIIMYQKRNLWERTIEQEDFLDLRVGIGDIPLQAQIDFPRRSFNIEVDVLQDDLEALSKEPKMLKQVPITYSLLRNSVSGVIGENTELVEQFIKGLIVRITATHSYDEVKLIIIADKDNTEKWKCTKWLPHIWNNNKTMRYYVDNENDAKELFSFIDKVYEEYDEKDSRTVNQYYVVINVGRELTNNSETFKRISTDGVNRGFIVINVSDELKNLPKECSRIIEVGTDKSKIYDKNDISGECQYFEADTKLLYDVNEIARYMSNIKLDLSSESGALPNMLTFLDMYNIGKIEHLNSLTRWKENNPIVSLKAPIGVDSNGNTFYLDLHEKFQGPHGLVAGMTGSGKSEFIISYILSMAINYHPSEVSFILIDYKGGGLAGAFENLPHIAGTITNLDGSAVNRSLISIQSELRRRQAIFNEARKIANEGTIDIYKYQRLYRDGIVSTPVPHLFIISDEFAELKAQQPEFMHQLISASRIGRSLGIHLILATQKPSGVVDDQIWSNTRFRVCLKVQEKSDSMDMIKRPDAAELSNTGRFYLQVGFNEYFDIGQSAWSGAPYVPSETAYKEVAATIEVIDNLGRSQKSVKLAREEKDNNLKLKQVVSIVNYLSELAHSENINVEPLWLPEIPEYIYISDILERYAYSRGLYGIEAVVGEYDDPFNQSQNILTIPFVKEGNVILYGNPTSGKEVFLTTLIYDLCSRYSPEEVNIYIMDFGTEMLRVFEGAPQVGDIVYSPDQEKLHRLMQMLNDRLQHNRKLLAQHAGNMEMYYKSTGRMFKSTLIVVNNFASIVEMYEDILDDLYYLVREGSKYGIYFIFTATTNSEIKYKILQNCGQSFVLQMNDKTDYTAILGSVEGVYPSKKVGRGILKLGHAYEFQTGRVCKDEELYTCIPEKCNGWKSIYEGHRAENIPIVPEVLNYKKYMNGEIEISSLPIGVDLATVKDIGYNLLSNVITVVGAKEYKRLETTARALQKLISNCRSVKLNIFNQDTTEKDVIDLYKLMVERNNNYKDTKDNSQYEQLIYVIEQPVKFMSGLSSTVKNNLEVLMLKCEAAYKVNFVLCADIRDIRELMTADWYMARTDNQSFIWVGDGFDEQSVLSCDLTSKDVRGLKKDNAIISSGGEAHRVKIVTDSEEVNL